MLEFEALLSTETYQSVSQPLKASIKRLHSVMVVQYFKPVMAREDRIKYCLNPVARSCRLVQNAPSVAPESKQKKGYTILFSREKTVRAKSEIEHLRGPSVLCKKRDINEKSR